MRWFEAILVLDLGLGVVLVFFTTLPPPPLVAKVLLLSVCKCDFYVTVIVERKYFPHRNEMVQQFLINPLLLQFLFYR